MRSLFIVLILLGSLLRFNTTAAQGKDSISATDSSRSPATSTITSPGSVNTGETTNTGILSADTSLSVFVLQALSASEKEIMLGKAAQKKALNNDVKAFASRMVSDHSKSKAELSKLAVSRKMSHPGGPTTPADSLERMKGAAFDKAYMKAMVSDHETAINLFSKAVETVKDDKIQAYIAKSLPMLKSHYAMATQLLGKLNADRSD